MILVGELFSLLASVDAGVGCFTSRKVYLERVVGVVLLLVVFRF